MVTALEGMEERLAELWKVEMKAIQDDIGAHMATVDHRMDQQGARMDEMQLKMTMTMDSIGKIQQEQVMVAKTLKTATPPRLVIPAREEAGIMGIRPGESAIHRAVPFTTQPMSSPP